MTLWQHLKRPPWRTMLLLFAILALFGIAYVAWSPGRRVRDGRHDLRSNGIWIGHGWIGDDLWFRVNPNRDKGLFRDDKRIRDLASLLSGHGIKYIFPHLCPCKPSGVIAAADPAQAERFLAGFKVPKFYRQLMSAWTSEVLDWAGGTQVLLGIPAYDDAGVGYHFPEVENLENALLGVHAGLCRNKALPKNYAGVAIYCEWEMDQSEWLLFRREFEKTLAR